MINNLDIDIRWILEHFPFRIALTDYCNLKCFFCSNEGMDLMSKNRKHINYSHLTFLIDLLCKNGLKNISLTGGDPTCYNKLFELIDFLKKYNFRDVFFHTNGIKINKVVINELVKICNKIAISVHTPNLENWMKMTQGSQSSFRKLFRNLEYLSTFANDIVIEMKYVPIRGYNDSLSEIREFIELCNEYGFKFKFLNFEPILPQHDGLSLDINELENILINLGCEHRDTDLEFRGQSSYLPIKTFFYKNTKGVAIEIGCGTPKVCADCYKSNEIFITPYSEIKPCHAQPFVIPLRNFIEKKENDLILQKIVESRVYLSLAPGSGQKLWSS